RRAINQVADRALVGIPFHAVAPVFLGDLEPLEGRLFTLAEASELLILADREPELSHDQVVANELVLEIVDLGVRPHPVGFRAQVLDPFDQHTAIPRAVEDHDPAAAGNMPPEAPQVGLRALLLGRSGNRYALILPRVQRLRHSPDRSTFAGSVVPL